MTYSPGSSGYPPGSYGYGAPAPAAEPGTSKLPVYLNVAVVVFGIAAYISAFGPVLTASTNLGPFPVEVTSTGGILLTLAAVLAALLAAIALLPKTNHHATMIAILAVLGVLAVVEQIVNKPQGAMIGWALWLVLAFVVLQAIAAVLVLLFDTGVLAPPAPKPRYEAASYGGYGQYGGYGAPGGYYGQPGPPQVGSAPRPGYPQPGQPGQQYGGYPQQGAGITSYGPRPEDPSPPTPPTGFPSFGPPSAEAGSPGGQHHLSDPDSGSNSGSSSSSSSSESSGPTTGSSSS